MQIKVARVDSPGVVVVVALQAGGSVDGKDLAKELGLDDQGITVILANGIPRALTAGKNSLEDLLVRASPAAEYAWTELGCPCMCDCRPRGQRVFCHGRIDTHAFPRSMTSRDSRDLCVDGMYSALMESTAPNLFVC